MYWRGQRGVLVRDGGGLGMAGVAMGWGDKGDTEGPERSPSPWIPASRDRRQSSPPTKGRSSLRPGSSPQCSPWVKRTGL